MLQTLFLIVVVFIQCAALLLGFRIVADMPWFGRLRSGCASKKGASCTSNSGNRVFCASHPVCSSLRPLRRLKLPQLCVRLEVLGSGLLTGLGYLGRLPRVQPAVQLLGTSTPWPTPFLPNHSTTNAFALWHTEPLTLTLPLGTPHPALPDAAASHTPSQRRPLLEKTSWKECIPLLSGGYNALRRLLATPRLCAEMSSISHHTTGPTLTSPRSSFRVRLLLNGYL